MDARCRMWCGAVPISPQGCCAAHIVWGAGAAALGDIFGGGCCCGAHTFGGFLRGTHTEGCVCPAYVLVFVCSCLCV